MKSPINTEASSAVHLRFLLVVLVTGFCVLLKGELGAQTLTTIHSFSAFVSTNSIDYPFTNSDGAYPDGNLVLSGDTLYGTATFGGESAGGTVFKVNIDGTGFTTLHSFDIGSLPQGG